LVLSFELKNKAISKSWKFLNKIEKLYLLPIHSQKITQHLTPNTQNLFNVLATYESHDEER